MPPAERRSLLQQLSGIDAVLVEYSKSGNAVSHGRMLAVLTAVLLLAALSASLLVYRPEAICSATYWHPRPRAQLAPSAQIYIGVVSASANRVKREAIRRSWGSDQRLLRVVFVVAKPSNNSALSRSIRQEALQHRDTILVTHVQEHYLNITHQTLEIYRSALAFGRPMTHVMKCDDDSYVHVTRLLELLAAHPQNSTFFGLIHASYAPDRNPLAKWHVSKEEWPHDWSGFSWANGPGYVLTADMAMELAAGAAVDCTPGKLFKLEDIATGMWLNCLATEKGYQMHSVSDARFNTRGCATGDIVSHYRTAAQMTCMFARGGECCD